MERIYSKTVTHCLMCPAFLSMGLRCMEQDRGITVPEDHSSFLSPEAMETVADLFDSCPLPFKEGKCL